MIRIVKIGLVVTVVLWGFFGVLGNVLHWGETTGSVAAVTTMATIEGGADSWQATSSPSVIWLGALFIMLFGGFIVIAESWFELWRSEAMAGVLSAALRYGSMIALVGIFVALPDND